MKDYISYFYNMIIDDISAISQKYTIKSGQYRYVLKKCDNLKIETYYMKLEQQLAQYSCFYKLVLNRNNNLVTTIEGKQYILLQVDSNTDNKINYCYLNNKYNVGDINKLFMINHFPWHKFWKQKIDYIEEWFESKREKYKRIYPLFYFFIGLGENALMYIKNAEIEETPTECDILSFQHVRISSNTMLSDYYDPTTLIVDHSSRDIGEYVKSIICNGTFDLEKFMNHLNKLDVSKYWLRMLYGRIMFPSYFFDYIEKIMNNSDNITSELEIEQNMDDILAGLKKIGEKISEEYHIPVVNWITKKV